MTIADIFEFASRLFETSSVAAVALAVFASLVGAVVELFFRKNTSISDETSVLIQDDKAIFDASERPFEEKALNNYYKQALLQATMSFWFGLVFAAIGFGVIVFAIFAVNGTELGGTLVKVFSGVVIDAVAGLFLVQSTNSKKTMSEFFEKLRLDRMNAEARNMITQIESEERRDQLRAQLILRYAGIETPPTG